MVVVWRCLWLTFTWLGLMIAVWACSVKEDGEVKGLCAIRTKCEQAVILPSDPSSTGYSIEPLFNIETIGLECSNGGWTATAWAALVQSQQEETLAAWQRSATGEPQTLKLKVLGPAEIATESSNGGGGGSDKKVPLSGIKVNVETSGHWFDDDRTHPDVKDMRSAKSKQYARGIGTSPQLWCSDSCGVITVDYYVYCPPPGTDDRVTIMISSGATAFNTTMSVKTQEFAEEKEKEGAAWLRGLAPGPGLVPQFGGPAMWMYARYSVSGLLALVEYMQSVWMRS